MGKLRLNAVDTVVIDEVDACLIEHETREVLNSKLFSMSIMALTWP
jgi:hypothetical protein